MTHTSRPRVEEVVYASLTGEQKEMALHFIDFLKELRMTPQWASSNSWAVTCKGKRICYIKVNVDKHTWYIRPALLYDEELDTFCREENLVEIMLNNVHFCSACGRCAPGKTAEFFGCTLKHVCCAPIDFEFHNPGQDDLKCVKKLVGYSKKKIASK